MLPRLFNPRIHIFAYRRPLFPDTGASRFRAYLSKSIPTTMNVSGFAPWMYATRYFAAMAVLPRCKKNEVTKMT